MFNFSGIFATAGTDVLDALLEEFSGIGKPISAPFVGIGVSHVRQAAAIPADDDPESSAFADQLIAFSKRFPDTTFVYLYAECFGGICEYAGFAFRNGHRIHDEPFRDDTGTFEPLQQLVSHLGVRLGNRPYFAPLERTFFLPHRPPATRPPSSSPTAKPKRSLWSRLFGRGPTAR